MRRSLLGAAALCLLAGCAQQPPPALRLQTVDLAGLRRVLGHYRGRVVLVDFWATWCAPCVKSYPKLVAWQQTLGGRGLTVVTVSTDDPARAGRARGFLADHPGAAATLLLDTPDYTAFVQGFHAPWGGEVPALFLFDRAGRLRHALTGEHEPEEIEPLVIRPLDEPARP